MSLQIFFIHILQFFCLLFNPNYMENKQVDNTPIQQGWTPLFNGVNLDGWHSFGQTKPGSAWKALNGSISLDASLKEGWQIKGGGDLVNDQVFENFHLKLEWKIAKGGNSGIIFFVQDDPAKYKHVWHTGLEMQVLDPSTEEEKSSKHSGGSLYDLIAANPQAVKPAGEWNAVEIIVNYPTLTFILNGKTVVNTILGDENWKNLIKASKFSKGETPDFAAKFSGHIALQDHGSNVSYRNIMIKKL